LTQSELKEQAARRAAGLVEDGMTLGLGSGSTSFLVLDALAARLRAGDLTQVMGVPTSAATREYAEHLGIPLSTLDELVRLDMTLDGADEVDSSLDVIKGLGGAHLWEKIVASVTDRLVIVVDESKLVSRLGTLAPLPVEVVPFGWRTTLGPLHRLGAVPELRTREDGAPFVTDSGNYILHCRFDGGIPDPRAVEDELHRYPAVVETGLFLDMVDTVVVGAQDGVRLLRRAAA
jgi:ribose 5-phosphate isomerase A